MAVAKDNLKKQKKIKISTQKENLEKEISELREEIKNNS